MYLTNKVYVKNWKHTPKRQRSKLSLTIGGKKINTDKAVHVDFEVAYWRKANMIHQWFVDNVQEGVDNCSTYYVSFKKLQELYAICIGLKELFEETKEIKETIQVIENKTDKSSLSKEDIKTLEQGKNSLNKWQEVAEELLPTQEGFFFGIYEYGEEYMIDIESTIEQLKDISEDGDYFYQASW